MIKFTQSSVAWLVTHPRTAYIVLLHFGISLENFLAQGEVWSREPQAPTEK